VSRISWPRITTIRQPVFDMAVAAADMVVAQLEGREPRRRIQHPHQLIIRESVAPPSTV
jgi:LacI family transcriptional regulator